jgi:putative ABC transport system permease protein
MVGAGLVLGVALALVLGRALRALLFGVEPTDLFTVAGTAAMFVTVALLTCWLPARRASKIDPLVALRQE